jgi:hypothetical protein
MKSSTWAARASDDAAETLATFQEKLPVRLIATERSALKTCRSDEELSVVVARNEEGFDYFPVVECADGIPERIIGLVKLVPFMEGLAPQGFVRDAMQHLSEENLIGADAGLLTFIRNADRQRCRLSSGRSRDQWSGESVGSAAAARPRSSIRDGYASQNHPGECNS